MGVVQYFNEKFNDFRMLLFRPRMGARRVVRKANLGSGVKLVTLFGFIAGLIGVMLMAIGKLLGSLVNLFVSGTTADLITAAIESILGVIIYVIVFLPAIIALIIILIVWYGLIWGTAKLLGGQADYGTHFGVMAYPLTLCFILSSLIIGLLTLLASVLMPLVSILAVVLLWIEAIVLLLLWLYILWLQIAVTSEVHQFDLMRAGASVVLPSLVLSLGAVIVLVVFSAILATLVGTMAFGALPF